MQLFFSSLAMTHNGLKWFEWHNGFSNLARKTYFLQTTKYGTSKTKLMLLTLSNLFGLRQTNVITWIESEFKEKLLVIEKKTPLIKQLKIFNETLGLLI